VAIFCRRSRARHQDALASRSAGGELTLDPPMLAEPGRNASDCGDHPLSSGDNVILQVDRLGEKRIWIACRCLCRLNLFRLRNHERRMRRGDGNWPAKACPVI
jgi:hypothetical protein